jgi:hypothetical protein
MPNQEFKLLENRAATRKDLNFFQQATAAFF